MFGPSDAVEFVQKLLKVTAHFAFTCLSEKLVDFFMELIILSGWFPLRLSSLLVVVPIKELLLLLLHQISAFKKLV